MKQLLSICGLVPLVVFLLVTPAFARPHAVHFGGGADLALTIRADATYNGGDPGTITAIVTNLGPGASGAARVGLANVASLFFNPADFGCVAERDSEVCGVPSLAFGESHSIEIHFVPPATPGPITLSASLESLTDPNHSNDTATATSNVVSMVDLVTSVSLFPSPMQPGKTSTLAVAVRNVSSLRATGVTVFVTIPASLVVNSSDRFSSSVCTPMAADPTTYACSMRDLERSDGASVFFLITPPTGSSPTAVSVSARAESAQPEWNPADNRVAHLLSVEIAPPDLTLSFSQDDKLDGNNRATLTFTITNPTSVPTKTLTAITSFDSNTNLILDAPGWQCGFSPGSLTQTCRLPSLGAHATTAIRVPVQFPTPTRQPRTSASLVLSQDDLSSQTLSADVVFFRSFDVTTTADGGPGSLRQAIIDSNAQCSADVIDPVPCRIAFRIPAPVPAPGWFTIEPLSPLPQITGTDLTIDGQTQTALTGDTNPLGPEVFLLGDHAGDCDGLQLMSGLETIRDLAIGGFAQNAIDSLPRSPARTATSRPGHLIEGNYLGLDPTGTRAVANGLRGVMASGFRGQITHNVISGNLRSGIYLTAASNTAVTDNRIGVSAGTDDPLPNGASGVFFADTSTVSTAPVSFDHPLPPVTVEGNVIEFNHDFGVALDPNSSIQILDNVIARNRGAAIDLGMDGPTLGSITGPVAPLPAIAAARYDAATGETSIEGTAAATAVISQLDYTATVYLYASDSAVSEGQRFLGAAPTDRKGRFVFRIKSDLRGKYISATTDLAAAAFLQDGAELDTARTTSEFSPTTAVMEP